MKEVKTVRIETSSVNSKWNAFVLYARALNKSPRILLGEVLDEFITSNLAEITVELDRFYIIEGQSTVVSETAIRNKIGGKK